jgi:hypothetical protein
MPLLGKKKHHGQAPWFFKEKLEPKRVPGGWRFTLKGSPRHYDDVLKIIEDDPNARVYFGEALAYERGAGIALWRVEATGFDWLPKLYAWWAEMERVEPIKFTFHLYLPSDLKYAEMDLRAHTPEQVAEFIKQNAPNSPEEANRAARRN